MSQPAARRTRGAALAAAVSGLALVAGLLTAPGSSANPTPPPNPSDSQLQSAAAQKQALANEVGRLSAEVTQAQTRLNQLQAQQELAEQKLAYQLSLLEEAKQRSIAAQAHVVAAQRGVDRAQQEFQAYVQAAYMSGGDIGGSTGALLTAQDPNVVLQQSALTQYEAEHQIDAIGALRKATVEKSNADAAARAAVARQKAAAAAAAQAKSDADAAVTAAVAATQQVQATLASTQTQLSAKQEQLATLNHQRTVYLAYVKRQAEIRAARIAAAKKRAEEARQARQRELARERAIARRRQEQQNNNGNGGTGGNGGGNGGGGSNAGNGGSGAGTQYGGGWSLSKGEDAVHRAERYLGMMYAWAGGNADGPTYGVCAGDGAYNDCHIVGFDCSGLTLYGWAPYLYMPHYAASQYSVAGSYHPSLSNLEPGDLLFWSSNGSQSGIHHVAMYVGGGNVIQAPQSGSVIQITPVDQVDWGYFGATRPLT